MLGFRTIKKDPLEVGDILVDCSSLSVYGAAPREVIKAERKEFRDERYNKEFGASLSYTAQILTLRTHDINGNTREYEWKPLEFAPRTYRVLVGSLEDYMEARRKRKEEVPRWTEEEKKEYQKGLRVFEDRIQDIYARGIYCQDLQEADDDAQKAWKDYLEESEPDLREKKADVYRKLCNKRTKVMTRVTRSIYVEMKQYKEDFRAKLRERRLEQTATKINKSIENDLRKKV